jgi:hypothetical protein
MTRFARRIWQLAHNQKIERKWFFLEAIISIVKHQLLMDAIFVDGSIVPLHRHRGRRSQVKFISLIHVNVELRPPRWI